MSINLSDRNTTLVYEIDMDSSEKQLSGLTAFRDSGSTTNRTLLKDRSADTLCDYIGSGRISEGTKLTEREVTAPLTESTTYATPTLHRFSPPPGICRRFSPRCYWYHIFYFSPSCSIPSTRKADLHPLI